MNIVSEQLKASKLILKNEAIANASKHNPIIKNATSITYTTLVCDLVIGLCITNFKNRSKSANKNYYANHHAKSKIQLHETETILLYQTIAKKIGCSIKLVEYAISKAVRAGIIRRSVCCGHSKWITALLKISKIKWMEFWHSLKGIKYFNYKEWQRVNTSSYNHLEFNVEQKEINGSIKKINSSVDDLDVVDWGDDDDPPNQI